MRGLLAKRLKEPIFHRKIPADCKTFLKNQDKVGYQRNCRVKGLQLKTGCPIEAYFKLWYQKLKLWVVKNPQNRSGKSMRAHGSKFGVKMRPQNCQKLENVVGKIKIFLAQNPTFLAQNLIFFNGFPISEKSEKIFLNGFLISSTAFRSLQRISNFCNGFQIFNFP